MYNVGDIIALEAITYGSGIEHYKIHRIVTMDGKEFYVLKERWGSWCEWKSADEVHQASYKICEPK